MAAIALRCALRVDADGVLVAEITTDLHLGMGVVQAPRAVNRGHGFVERAYRRIPFGQLD